MRSEFPSYSYTDCVIPRRSDDYHVRSVACAGITSRSSRPYTAPCGAPPRSEPTATRRTPALHDRGSVSGGPPCAWRPALPAGGGRSRRCRCACRSCPAATSFPARRPSYSCCCRWPRCGCGSRRAVSGSVRPALVGLSALALFALWEGLSIAWSVGPDLSWLAFDVTRSVSDRRGRRHESRRRARPAAPGRLRLRLSRWSRWPSTPSSGKCCPTW